MKIEPIECSETSAFSTQDVGEISKRKRITYETRRKLKIKNSSPLWGGNVKTHPSSREITHQENQTPYLPQLPTSLPRPQHYTTFPAIPSSHPLPGRQQNTLNQPAYEDGTDKVFRIVGF